MSRPPRKKKPKGRKRNLDREAILARLLDGTIVVEWETHSVYTTAHHGCNGKSKFKYSRRHDLKIRYFGCRESCQYPFVRLRIDMIRSWVPCHHLVWMLHNKQIIPEGMHVDHIDANIDNWNPTNLQLLSPSDHHAKTHGGSDEPDFAENFD